MESVLVRPDGDDLETLGAWISRGRVRPVIDRSYGLDDAIEAHRYSAQGRARGKIVLVVDGSLAEGSRTTEAGKVRVGTVAGRA